MRIVVKSVSYHYDECTQYYQIVDISEKPYVASSDEQIFHELHFVKKDFTIYQKLRQLEVGEIYEETFRC